MTYYYGLRQEVLTSLLSVVYDWVHLRSCSLPTQPSDCTTCTRLELRLHTVKQSIQADYSKLTQRHDSMKLAQEAQLSLRYRASAAHYTGVNELSAVRQIHCFKIFAFTKYRNLQGHWKWRYSI